MLRTRIITAIQDYLKSTYTGPITILKNEDDADLVPPYAVVRIGSAEDIGMGQVNIWDFNVILAIFQDADDVTIETAETDAAELFDLVAGDPDPLLAALVAADIVPSAWDTLTTEAGQVETRWMHTAAFRLVASPAAAE